MRKIGFFAFYRQAFLKFFILTVIGATIIYFIVYYSNDLFSLKALEIIFFPILFAMTSKLLDKHYSLVDTYQLAIETEYKLKHGLISRDEYIERMTEIKEIEKKDSQFYKRKRNKK